MSSCNKKKRLELHRVCIELVVVWNGHPRKIDVLLADVHEAVVCILTIETVPCSASSLLPWHRIHGSPCGLAGFVVLTHTAHPKRLEPPPTSSNLARAHSQSPPTGRRAASHRANCPCASPVGLRQDSEADLWLPRQLMLQAKANSCRRKRSWKTPVSMRRPSSRVPKLVVGAFRTSSLFEERGGLLTQVVQISTETGMLTKPEGTLSHTMKDQWMANRPSGRTKLKRTLPVHKKTELIKKHAQSNMY